MHKLRRPRSTAAAVGAKNSPPDCFINAPTVLKEIIIYHYQKYLHYVEVLFFCTNCGVLAAQLLRSALKTLNL